MCPEGNPNKERPVSPKMKLVETCFNSFNRAFKGCKIEVHFIIDKPNAEIMQMIKRCKFPYTVEILRTPTWEEGNEASFFRQLDIAGGYDGKVFLLEDDYFFVMASGKKIMTALDELEIVTPYYHPGYDKELKHNYKKDVIEIGGINWINVIDTTLTFATHGDIIRDNIDKFKSNSVWDEKMWQELRGYKIWYPDPTLATHMESKFLAPGIYGFN